MAETTLTRYLKLRLAADLSADARYNLQRIDALGATFIADATANLQIRSVSDINIEPESPDIGGSGDGSGIITLGSLSNLATIIANSDQFYVRSSLSLLNGTSPDTYLSLIPEVENGNLDLTIGLDGSNKAITIPYSGALVTEDGVQVLTNKNVTGTFTGPLTGNVIGNLAGNVTGNVTGNVSGTAANITATSNNTLTTLSALSLPGSQVSGDIGGNATNVTGTVAVANGGTGAVTAESALVNLLPAYINSGTLKVKSDGSGLEWVVGAGQGTVTAVTASSPLSITGDANLTPNVTIAQASSSVSGYLSNTDWSTFNTVLTKEPAITASGNAAQFWNGNKTFAAVTKGDVGLGNVDNTSDVNKPISSATQTALNAKYDSSNPLAFVDASGAKAAAVINSTLGNETDQAASVAAMKWYVGSYSGGSYAANWTSGTSITLTHGLNTEDISINLYDISTREEIQVDSIVRGDGLGGSYTTKVTLTSSVVPTGSGWRVIVRK